MAGLRICLKGDGLQWIKDESGIGGHLSNFGSLSPLNVYIQPLRAVAFNVSVFIDKGGGGFGEWNHTSGSYDGCLGRLQRNESDILTFDVPWPQPTEDFILSAIVQSSKSVFWSMYDPETESSNVVDIMSAFSEFNYDACLLIASSLMLVTLMTAASSFLFYERSLVPTSNRVMDSTNLPDEAVLADKIKKKKKRLFHAMLTSTIPYFSAEKLRNGQSCGLPLLKIVFLVLVFYVKFYFASMIKTEAVVQKKPTTIESFDDILSRDDVRVHFSTASNVYLEFKNAEAGSKKRLIFERALKEQKDYKDDDMLNARVAQVDVDHYARLDAAVACLSPVNNRSLPLVRSEDSKEELHGILRSRFVRKVVGKAVDRKYSRLIAMGAYDLWLRQIFYGFKPALEKSSRINLQVCVCMDRVSLPDKGVHALSLRQHHGLFLLLVVGCIIALYAMIAEHMMLLLKF